MQLLFRVVGGAVDGAVVVCVVAGSVDVDVVGAFGVDDVVDVVDSGGLVAVGVGEVVDVDGGLPLCCC